MKFYSMEMKHFCLRVLLGFMTFTAFISPGAKSSPLKNKIYAVLQQPGMQSVKVGIDVELLGSRKKIFSYNASTLLTPASNLKLLTTSCALLKLGPDYRFKTLVLANEIRQGIVEGNLVLKGSGDPTWNKDFYPNATIPLIILAQKLKEEGVKVVTGDLVVDDSFFDHEFTGIGWKKRYQWDDYAAETGALSLNYNEVKVSISPGSYGGSPPRVSLWPANHFLHVENHAWTAPGPSSILIHRDRLRNWATVRGHISPYSGGTSFSFNIHDPPLFVGSAFEEILRQNGITVRGNVRKIRTYEIGKNPEMKVLAEIESPPLLKIVHLLNKESINFLAEHLFRTLGAIEFGKGTITNGRLAIRRFLKELEIRNPYIVMSDGSGLSEQDKVSPEILVKILEGMAVRPIGPQFKDTLPIGGIDGTLEDRLKGVNVRAKTGAIAHVSALSGYVVTGYGQTVIFSIILNNFSFSMDEADDTIDKIVRIIAQTKEPL